jgi:hypothetical protein
MMENIMFAYGKILTDSVKVRNRIDEISVHIFHTNWFSYTTGIIYMLCALGWT